MAVAAAAVPAVALKTVRACMFFKAVTFRFKNGLSLPGVRGAGWMEATFVVAMCHQ